MANVIEGLLSTGPIGAVLAIMLWFNYQLIKKLFKIIETNTQALTKNTDTLDELIKAQNRRRREFGGNE